MKITSYPAHTSTTLAAEDVFLTDGIKGTKKIAKSDLTYALFDDIPMMHKQIFRGKQIGTTLSVGQAAEIAAGTFHDIWIGDYWRYFNVTWRIIDMDYYIDQSIINHHLVVMPDSPIETSFMDGGSDAKVNGFGNTDLFKKIESYEAPAAAVFGSTHLLDHLEILTSEWFDNYKYVPSGNRPSGFNPMSEQYTRSVCIPSEVQMRGAPARGTVWAGAAGYNSYDHGQFRIFQMGQPYGKDSFWLRDQSWNTYFSRFDPTSRGFTDAPANSPLGVRPYYTIG